MRGLPNFHYFHDTRNIKFDALMPSPKLVWLAQPHTSSRRSRGPSLMDFWTEPRPLKPPGGLRTAKTWPILWLRIQCPLVQKMQFWSKSMLMQRVLQSRPSRKSSGPPPIYFWPDPRSLRRSARPRKAMTLSKSGARVKTGFSGKCNCWSRSRLKRDLLPLRSSRKSQRPFLMGFQSQPKP